MRGRSNGDSNAWKTISLFSIIFLIASLLLFFIALAHYWQVTLKERTDFQNTALSTINQGKFALQQQLAGVVSDINYLSAYGERYQDQSNPRGSLFDNTTQQQQALATLLTTFSQEKKAYDQIRFLSPSGDELLRINYNQGQPFSVSEADLQTKSSRYYFQEISQLDKSELYLSPLDLNIENGAIETPHKPVIRIAKPVYNAEGERKGSLLLNLIGKDLLQAFRDATLHTDATVALLNKQGYWLSSTKPTQEWGFMLPHKDRFANTHPTEWQQIRRQIRGQFETDNYLVSFDTIRPLSQNSGSLKMPQWKVVSLIPQSHPILKGAINSLAIVYGPILLLLAIGSWLIARTVIRHRQSELQVTFERRFRRVLEHVSLLALAVDKQGNVTFCNHSLCQLLGWQPGELIGKNWLEICVADDYKETASDNLHQIISGQAESLDEDALIKTRDKQVCKVEWNHTLMSNPDGEVIGLTCIGKNVTQIREQEKELHTLSRAIEQSPIVVMIVDTAGGIQYVNPRFSEVTGYSLEEVRGKNPRILQPVSNSNDADYQSLWASIKNGKTWHGVFKNQKKNGEIYWASASISGLRDQSGEIVNYIGVQEDITERLGLEQKFRMSVEGSPYAMVMIDEQGKIILINSRTEEYFAYSRQELLGQKIEMLIPTQSQHEHIQSRTDFIHTETSKPNSKAQNHSSGRKLKGLRKDGSIFPVEIALNLIDTDEGKITLASIVDITNRDALEKELAVRNKEVAKSKTLAIVGRMASMVAHDLRNPLSSIKMSLQILSKPPKEDISTNADANSKELKSIALEQVTYMETILEDLLNYARPPALNPQWLELSKLINQTIIMLQGSIQLHHVKIQSNIQTGLPTIYADPGKLKQIFSNLINNAIHAATESGQQADITIEGMAQLGGKVPAIQIEITDNGPGINDDLAEQLFEPFYTTRAKGSGLGLAIVRGFIEQHHGQVQLSSREAAQGTRCTVILPIAALVKPKKDQAKVQ